MRSHGRESHTRVTLQHELSFSLLSPPPIPFSIPMNPKQHQHNAVLSGLQQSLWLVLIEIIVWYEAEPPLCLSSYSYHGVTGWHTDSAEILQGTEHWKCIQAQHRGFYPHEDFQVAGYSVLCFVNNRSYSRRVSCLVRWISKNSRMVAGIFFPLGGRSVAILRGRWQ